MHAPKSEARNFEVTGAKSLSLHLGGSRLTGLRATFRGRDRNAPRPFRKAPFGRVRTSPGRMGTANPTGEGK